jgi:hypothetical protein
VHEPDRVPRGGIVEGEHGNSGRSLGRRGRDERGAEAEPGEADDGVGGAQLERHGALDAGPLERRVDLQAEPRLGAHLDERARGRQLGERNPGSLGEGRGPVDDGDQRLVGDQVVDDPGRHLVGGQAHEREVQVAGAHLLGHVPAARVVDGDLDRGVPTVELEQGLLDARRAPAGRAHHAQAQPARDHARERREFGPGQLGAAQQLTGVGQQELSRRRHPDRPAGAVEQGHPQLPLEPCHLRAESGLDDVAPRGGPGEAALVGHRHHELELPQIHLGIRSLRPQHAVGQIVAPIQHSMP